MPACPTTWNLKVHLRDAASTDVLVQVGEYIEIGVKVKEGIF